MLGLLSLAALLIFSAHPVFWSVPSTYFAGTGAAGAIALISSIGVSSGMVSPWVIGQIRTATGSTDGAIYLLAGLLAVCAVTFVAGVKKEAR